MMRKIIFLLSFLILAFAFDGFAQIKKANRMYDLFKYSRAIPYYQKAAKSNKEDVRKEATIKLADCYRFINDPQEARSWYMRAVEFNNIDPVNYFYLGQAARTMQEYEQAREAFLRYAELVPDDPRGAVFAGYCDLMAQWSAFGEAAEVKNVKNLNSKYSDFGPAFFGDGLIYVSDRNPSLLEDQRYGWTNFNYLNLYQAEPRFFKDFWQDMDNPVSMSTRFNQTYHDGPAYFTPDNKMIFLTRTRIEKVKQGKSDIMTFMLKIYYGELTDGKVDYKDFPFNSDNYSVGHPTVSHNGNTMIFVSDMPGGFGSSDLYQTKLSGGVWTTPVNLGSTLNTFGNEVFPTLVNDSLLYFASDGHPGYGGLDIFVSRNINGEWSVPVNLYAPINSSFDDFSIAVNKDFSSGFFSSNRPGGLGNDDIYAFRNAKPPVKTISIPPVLSQPLVMQGIVRDKSSSLPLEGATVFILNTKTNKVKVLQTGPDGIYSMPAEKEILYLSKAVKPDFIDDCLNFRIAQSDTAKSFRIPRDLLLDKLEVNKSFRVENIYYDLDKWFIRDDAKPALDNLVDIMKKYPISAELSSHTDSRATHAYNEELSQKRAEAAVRYIVLQGIDPSRLVARGYGENNLVNQCADGVTCTEDEHQANRRTEFKILSIDKTITNDEFDPSVFKVGDEVDVYLFDPSFFRRCFGDNTVKADKKVSEQPNVVKTEISPAAEVKNPDSPAACFGVQIAAVPNVMPVNDPWFKGVKDIKIYKSGNRNKYIAGCETTMDAALALQKEIRSKGFAEAFVVKIENNQVLSAR